MAREILSDDFTIYLVGKYILSDISVHLSQNRVALRQRLSYR